MILYRLAGIAEQWSGTGLLPIMAFTTANKAEAMRRASGYVKRNKGKRYRLWLDKLTVAVPNQEQMIRLFNTEDPSELITDRERLGEWSTLKGEDE